MNVQLLFLGTAVVLTIVLTGLLVVFLQLARRSRSSTVRISAAAASIVVLLISPGVFDAVVAQLRSRAGAMYMSIDPGWMLKIAPAVVAAIIATVLIVWRRHDASSAPM